jgi:hypothetical protein
MHPTTSIFGRHDYRSKCINYIAKKARQKQNEYHANESKFAPAK